MASSRFPAAVTLLGVVGLLAASCSAGAADAGDNDAPFAGDTIEATIQYDWAPLAYRDNAGEPAGMYIDLLDAVAVELDAAIEWNETTFAQVIPGVQSGKYDIGVGADATSERQQVVDVVSTQQAGHAFLTRAEDGLEVDDELAELCGATVAVLAGQSTVPVLEERSEECVADGAEAIELATFPDQASAQLAVQSGRADVATAYRAFIQQAVKIEPDLAATGPAITSGFSGMTFAKGSGQAEAFAEALDAVIASGRYGEILAEHDLTEVAVDEARVNPAE
ncbi:transporter substrate-binding domain-containing protein [Georgenia sp. MJ173]|uniref:transporter substrate-binding domain-containing protein n=1 Tax=Georgenia sunbinii TaxID=3117728 RepID=UPI002F26215C